MPLFVDAQDRFYARALKDLKTIYVRCSINIKKESVECEIVLKGMGYIMGFDTFSRGEFLAYSKREDGCVSRLRIGEKKGVCITTAQYTLGNYVIISPDDKRIVFKHSRHIAKERRDAGDLYIAEFE